MLSIPLNNGDIYEIPLIVSFWFTPLAVQTDKLSSKLPTQTLQLRYPAARRSFSDTITSGRKIAVVLKLSNVTLAEFFTSTTKTAYNVDKPTKWLGYSLWHLKNEMYQEMLFYNFGNAWNMLLTGAIEGNALTATAIHSLVVIEHTTFQEADTLPLNYRRPSDIFVANV